ncbi:MAG TPA: WhiB family transcriptional regulator [Acidimicrobiaceae bacterium]|nr:WhiB family transcriptional regulator [Acidimicrobiaceae bacterium]
MDTGNCADTHPSVFFPADGAGVIAAQRICESCPVSAECLEYALHHRIPHGVWGGTSERQRRRIHSARRLRRVAANAQSAA